MSTMWGEARKYEQVYIVALIQNFRIFPFEHFLTQTTLFFSLMSPFWFFFPAEEVSAFQLEPLKLQALFVEMW